jgi:nucleotide-binding universal stress UspA family protein
MQLRQIVVGLDGSDNAQRAAQWAAGLASLTGAQVIVVHALGLLGYGSRDDITSKLKHEWSAPFTDAGVQPRYRVSGGTPVMAVLDTAEEFDADLIVLGSRGLGGFPELLLGSTSTQVAQHSHRPVVIIPSSSSSSEP